MRPREETQYMFELITPNDTHYNRLVELQKEFPDLTYKAKGYDSLSSETIEKHKDQLAEIMQICSETIYDFVEFQNFHIGDKSKTLNLRVRYRWSSRFTGVGYFDINHWNEESHKQDCIETGLIENKEPI